jgi:hypothetical protein
MERANFNATSPPRPALLAASDVGRTNAGSRLARQSATALTRTGARVPLRRARALILEAGVRAAVGALRAPRPDARRYAALSEAARERLAASFRGAAWFVDVEALGTPGVGGSVARGRCCVAFRAAAAGTSGSSSVATCRVRIAGCAAGCRGAAAGCRGAPGARAHPACRSAARPSGVHWRSAVGLATSGSSVRVIATCREQHDGGCDRREDGSMAHYHET